LKFFSFVRPIKAGRELSREERKNSLKRQLRVQRNKTENDIKTFF
jgi:hypothetical protein